MSDYPYIQEVSAANFQDMVIAASHQLPVLVDFWADWCQPCKTLMPMLMKLAEEYNGKFLLAKVNSDDNKELAAKYGIRSLPTVQLFMAGEPVDQFMGALPESQIRQFLDKYIPNKIDEMIALAEESIAQGDIAQANTILEQASTLSPNNSKITVVQVKLALAGDQKDQARKILESLDSATRDEPEIAALLTQLDIDEKLSDAPTMDELFDRLEADDNDSEARYLLALRAFEQQHYEAALEMLLTLLQKDRKYKDEAAQKGMLEIFNILGGEGELVTQYRRKMFTALH